jgi:hypothetical protein
MDAEAVKHLGGMCQVLGVVLVLRDVLNLARYRNEPAKVAAKVRAWWFTGVAAARRFLRLPGRSVTVHAGAAGAFGFAGSATVARGMRGPFIAQPGQSLQDQVNELGALVNRLREEVLREPQERERAIAAERQAREKELRALADRLEAVAQDLRHEFEKLKDTTTGGTRLRLEGVPVLLAGIVFTTWPDGVAGWLPSWPPLRVVVAFIGAYILARLTWRWWLPRDGQPMVSRPEVGCAVLWHGPGRPSPAKRPPAR